MRKNLFTERVVKPWNCLPGEVGNALSLSVSKTHLDEAINNAVTWSALNWSGSWT